MSRNSDEIEMEMEKQNATANEQHNDARQPQRQQAQDHASYSAQTGRSRE